MYNGLFQTAKEIFSVFLLFAVSKQSSKGSEYAQIRKRDIIHILKMFIIFHKYYAQKIRNSKNDEFLRIYFQYIVILVQFGIFCFTLKYK